MSNPMTPDIEFKMRLLRRPGWYPSPFPGTCETCGGAMRAGDPMLLVHQEGGVRWTCSCIFMPDMSLRERLSLLRRADLLVG